MPASTNGALEQARFKGMLELLKQQDAEIDQIVVYSKFAVGYLLQQEGPNAGWRKANIEGPVYLVRRRVAPRYQLLVKNQFSTNDLIDNLHAFWELDCQMNYIFYKVEDESKRIRGLWFHDDLERQRIEAALEKTLEEVRRASSDVQADFQLAKTQVMPTKMHIEVPPIPLVGGIVEGMDTLYAQFGLTKPAEPNGKDNLTITMSSLRAALHELVDDDNFLRTIMQKLKDRQPSARVSA